MTKKFKKIFAAALLAVAFVFALRAAIPNEGSSIVLNVTEQAKLWDFSGNYSESIEVNGVIVDLQFDLLHNEDGTISGGGTARVEGIDEASGEEMSMAAEFNVSGKVSTAGLLTRLEIKLESEQSDDSNQLALNLAIKAELDKDGEVTSTISGNLSVAGDQPKQLDIPANTELGIMLPDEMDGSWEFGVDNITGEGHEFSGNGYVTLSNGRRLELAANLTHKSSFDNNETIDTFTINFTYQNTVLSPMSNSIPLTVVAIVRSFGHPEYDENNGDYNDDMVEVKSFKGNLLGQAFNSVSDPATAPPEITTQPIEQTVAEGGKVTFMVAATGAAPLKFEWMKDGSPISGATMATYVIAKALTSHAGDYSVKVSNNTEFTDTSVEVSLTVTMAKPVITKQPAGSTVAEGGTANLSVTATGSELTYQWFKDGTELSDKTDATLTLSEVEMVSAGDYTVTVANEGGEAESKVAIIKVKTLPPKITTQPLTQSAAVGDDSVEFSVVATGKNLEYQWKKNGTLIENGTEDTLTLSDISSADAGSYTVTVSNSGGTVTSKPAKLTVLAPPEITTQPIEQTVAEGGKVTFIVAATGTAPLKFQWMKGGSPISGATKATYVIAKALASHAGDYSVKVSNDIDFTVSDEVSLEVTIPKPVITKQPLGSTVAEGGTAKLSVTAKGSELTYQWFKDGTELSDETDATLTLSEVEMDSAGEYTVIVTNDGGEVESKVAKIIVKTLPPKITTQPLAQSAAVGDDSVEFTVEATGGDLEYQWKKNGTAIEDATEDTLTLSDISSADAGSYTVTVSNSGGTVTSKAAKLTISLAPTSLEGYSVTCRPTKYTGAWAGSSKEDNDVSFDESNISDDGYEYSYEYEKTSATAGTVLWVREDRNTLITVKITFKTATSGSYTVKATDLDTGKIVATETGTFFDANK